MKKYLDNEVLKYVSRARVFFARAARLIKHGGLGHEIL